MTRSAAVYDLWKAIIVRALRDLRQRNGDAFVGVVIEAGLTAAREHLVRRYGPEAAFNTLTRQADAALAPILDASLPTHDGDR